MTTNNLIKIISRPLAVTVVFLMAALYSYGQLNTFQGMYFRNKYMYNPSMAGLDTVLNLNIGYRQQWSSFPGTPKTGSLTGDYQLSKKVGIGLNVSDDRAGLIRSTRVMGTYAYHLPLSSRNDHLNFGLSLGINDSRVDYSELDGDVTDSEVSLYNTLKAYVDGDFGMAYTSDKLYAGWALPNLKSVFFQTSDERFDADRMLFMAAVNYKIPLKGGAKGYTLEPMGAVRVVKGYNDIVDIGANFMLNNYGLYLQGIYHTSESMGIGIGLDQPAYAFDFSYNMETGYLGNYAHGGFEFGLKLKLFGQTATAR